MLSTISSPKTGARNGYELTTALHTPERERNIRGAGRCTRGNITRQPRLDRILEPARHRKAQPKLMEPAASVACESGVHAMKYGLMWPGHHLDRAPTSSPMHPTIRRTRSGTSAIRRQFSVESLPSRNCAHAVA